jgi:5-(carboxyamino)imidazole ribonucleotide synthase
VLVRPSARILELIQDRLVQKRFLHQQGFPVAAFREVRTAADLSAASELGYPCLCKTATAGYDGKGQWRLNGAHDLDRLQNLLPCQPDPARAWILERHIAFERELSVLVARDSDGRHAVYPVVANEHEHGILRRTTVPAPVDHATGQRAQGLAVAIVDALSGIGVFCVELFHGPAGELLVNEIAPRPHNSGHYTLDVCTVSQFEQQVRAVCGLPLGEARLLSPAVMVNILGDEVTRLCRGAPLRALLERPGIHLHLYGKETVRPGRKMGHITVTAETLQAAEVLAGQIARQAAEPVTSSAPDRAEA